VGLSNPYVRAGIVSLAFFSLVLFRVVQNYGGDWKSGDSRVAIFIVGFAMAITAAIAGAISSNSEKPWRWLKVGAVTLICALAVVILMLLVQKLYLR
jgi:hypothetical protein